jgi:hypothetical protein
MLSAVGLAAIAGCPPGSEWEPRGPVAAEESVQMVVARVNQNAQAMDFLLRVGGVSASGKVVRDKGKTESFDANGTLFFRRPRSLYMELKHSLAGKIEIGSNDQEFWYWERFEYQRYFTGQHASLAKPWESDVPLRPDQFLDILGFRELPMPVVGGAGPTFKVGNDRYYLNFFDCDTKGRRYEAKSLSISRRPPYLIRGVTYYCPDGRPWMRADIGGYKTIEETTVQAPTLVQIRSLKDASYMTLSFSTLKRSDNRQVEQQRIAKSPLQRGEDVGEIIYLDRRPSGRPTGSTRPAGSNRPSGSIRQSDFAEH